MAYENETQDVILERMLDAVSDEIDKRQGSVVWDLLAPASIELAQAYIELDNVLTFGFASENMPSNYLELRVGELGLTRKSAVRAVGQLTFSGDDGTVIPVGTGVGTDELEPKYFSTITEGTIIGGTVTVSAEADVEGAVGNVAAGTVTLVLGDVSGVTTVTNAQPFDGGTDVESDESLLNRYYDRVRKPVTSGNANHYILWAKEVAGIGDAKVYPLWGGNGTVKVVLLDEAKTAPAPSIVADALEHIESNRPVGATVTVVGATETAINVTATLTLVSGKTLTDAQTEFSTLLVDYLKTLAFVDPVVRYSKIASLLSQTTAIVDYASLTVNSGTANVTIADGAVAVAGAVTFT